MTYVQQARRAMLSLAIAAAMGPATLIAPRAVALMQASQPLPATTGPSTSMAAESLKVTVAYVAGKVQVRAGEDQPWQAATVGLVVDAGSEFRTGPKSSVRVTIPPDQSLTLDRLGTVKVLQALRDGNKLKTDMLMKYGRTKYSVEAAGLEHESTIASPAGTLAVRGTVVSLFDQPPFVPEAVSYTGQARFRDARRQVNIGAKGAGKQTFSTDKDSAAETALSNGVVDPKFAGARTASERDLIASEVARGGVVSFDPISQIAVIRGATPIANDAQLANSLPGKFDIVARWFGNADVNLEVFVDTRDPLKALTSGTGFITKEFLYPGYGLNHSASGGTIPFDNRGGPTGGTEVAFWKRVPKGATFGVGVQLVSGAPVDLKINAFLNGQKQYIYYVDANAHVDRSKTLHVTLDKNALIGGPNIYIPNIDDLLNATGKITTIDDGLIHGGGTSGDGGTSGGNGGSGGTTSGGTTSGGTTSGGTTSGGTTSGGTTSGGTTAGGGGTPAGGAGGTSSNGGGNQGGSAYSGYSGYVPPSATAAATRKPRSR